MKVNSRLFKAFIYTYIFGIIAYAVVLVNPYYIQDHQIAASPMTLDLFIGGVGAGRWFAGFTTILTLGAVTPWLAGIIGIGFVAISVYFVFEILAIRSELSIILIAGIMTVNRTLVFSNLYGGLYGFTAALLFSCLAAYFITKYNNRYSVVVGILGITMALATYGTYVAVAIVLLAFDVLIRCLNGESIRGVVKRTGAYAAITSVGFILYYVVFKMVLKFSGVTLASYQGRENLNTVSSALVGALSTIPQGYLRAIRYYLFRDNVKNSLYPLWLDYLIIGVSIIIFVLTVLRNIKENKIKKGNLCFLVIVLLLMPFLLGIPYILSMGTMHNLMDYIFVFPYILTIKLSHDVVNDIEKKDLLYKWGVFIYILVSLAIYYGIVFANVAYTHLDNMYVASISIGTRVIDRIETLEGADGSEYVILLGELDQDKYLSNNRYSDTVLEVLNNDVTDSYYLSKNVNTVFTEQGAMLAFLSNALGDNHPMTACWTMDNLNNLWWPREESKVEIYNSLGKFPANDCAVKVGDFIFIRLGDLE